MSDKEKKILTEFGKVVDGMNAEQLEKLALIAKGMEINENMHKKAG